MSRSKKKNPGGGISMLKCGEQVRFRASENRAKRRVVNALLAVGEYDHMPNEKEFGNEWASPRDGKSYWIDHDDKWMRK
jgi:hypothetical protein